MQVPKYLIDLGPNGDDNYHSWIKHNAEIERIYKLFFQYEQFVFFELDVYGGIMPTEYPVYSKSFELDPKGDIMPREFETTLGY